MNRADYHPDWPNVSRQIREQAGDRCETCGAENGAVGYRDIHGNFWEAGSVDKLAANNRGLHELWFPRPKVLTIVLTSAHLCQNTRCIEPTHLRALCQKHHLEYDRTHTITDHSECWEGTPRA